MQAVIEVVVSLIAALAMAVFAAMGVDLGDRRQEPPQAERVVARSPRAKPIAVAPAPVDCPDAQAAASRVA